MGYPGQFDDQGGHDGYEEEVELRERANDGDEEAINTLWRRAT